MVRPLSGSVTGSVARSPRAGRSAYPSITVATRSASGRPGRRIASLTESRGAAARNCGSVAYRWAVRWAVRASRSSAGGGKTGIGVLLVLLYGLEGLGNGRAVLILRWRPGRWK